MGRQAIAAGKQDHGRAHKGGCKVLMSTLFRTDVLSSAGHLLQPSASAAVCREDLGPRSHGHRIQGQARTSRSLWAPPPPWLHCGRKEAGPALNQRQEGWWGLSAPPREPAHTLLQRTRQASAAGRWRPLSRQDKKRPPSLGHFSACQQTELRRRVTAKPAEVHLYDGLLFGPQAEGDSDTLQHGGASAASH